MSCAPPIPRMKTTFEDLLTPKLLLPLLCLLSPLLKDAQAFFFYNQDLCNCPAVRQCPPVPTCSSSLGSTYSVVQPAAVQPVVGVGGCASGSCPYASGPYNVGGAGQAQSPPYSYAHVNGYAAAQPVPAPVVLPSYIPPPPPLPVASLVTPVESLAGPYARYFTAPSSASSSSSLNEGVTKSSKAMTGSSSKVTMTPRTKPTSGGSPTSSAVFADNVQSTLDDLYDDNLPSPDSRLRVADVSAGAKDLVPFDIYQKRYHYLRQLKNRILRQFSAPSVNKDSSVCNNLKLARVMTRAMVNDVSISKRLVRKATELSFNGKKFDVLCAVGDFSYSIYAEQYCETTKGDVTCFAFI